MLTTEKIFDAQTGLETIIEREMTAAELAEAEAAKAATEAALVAEAEREAARQALLDKLGITADEAKLLLG
jgi:hypothetical protein